jgi:hypothetical protein
MKKKLVLIFVLCLALFHHGFGQDLNFDQEEESIAPEPNPEFDKMMESFAEEEKRNRILDIENDDMETIIAKMLRHSPASGFTIEEEIEQEQQEEYENVIKIAEETAAAQGLKIVNKQRLA